MSAFLATGLINKNETINKKTKPIKTLNKSQEMEDLYDTYVAFFIFKISYL